MNKELAIRRLRAAAPAASFLAAPVSIAMAAGAPKGQDQGSYAGISADELEGLTSPHRSRITQTPQTRETKMAHVKTAGNKLFGGPNPPPVHRGSLSDLLDSDRAKTAATLGPNIVKSLVGMLTGSVSGRDIASIGSKFKKLAPDALSTAAELMELRDPMTARLVRKILPSLSMPGGAEKLVGRAADLTRYMESAADKGQALDIFLQTYEDLDPEWAQQVTPMVDKIVREFSSLTEYDSPEYAMEGVEKLIELANSRDAQIAKALQTASAFVDEGADQMQRMDMQGQAGRSARNMMFGMGALGVGGIVGDTMLDSVVAPGLAERSKARAQAQIKSETSLFDRSGFDEAAVKSLAQSLGGGLGDGLTMGGGAMLGAGATLARSPMYDRLFSQIVGQDNLLSRATPDEMTLLKDAYASMQRAAPTLSQDVFAVRNFLREVYSTGNGPDYTTISNLARAEDALHR